MKKSKFAAFLLSFIPGLSHLYAGLTQRAMIFFTLFGGLIIASVFVGSVSWSEHGVILFLIGFPILWLLALVDAISLIDKINYDYFNNTEPSNLNYLELQHNNHKVITIALSIIPGAGHMYLGMLNYGAILMTTFFATIFFMGWLNMSLFLFILPVVWFYSLFDAFHRLEDETEGSLVDQPAIFKWINSHPHIIGWCLIGLGVIVTFERIFAPMLTWEMRNYIQTILVATILIVGGIKLLMGNKINEREENNQCASGE